MNTPIVVQSSSNKKGNTHALIEEVFKDTPPIFIRISEHKISFVSETGSYSEDDEFSSLLKLLVRKNNIVLATPVYFSSVSGIMKNFIDRFYDVKKDSDFYKKLATKKLFVLATGEGLLMPQGFEVPFESMAKHLKMEYKGILYKSNKMPMTDSYFTELKDKFLEQYYAQ